MLSISPEYKDEPAYLQIQQSNCSTIPEPTINFAFHSSKPFLRIMQFQTLINAVALVLFIAGAHAKVQAGSIDSIVNKVKSSKGEDRAMTFNGEDKTVIVSLDDPTASKQQWIFTNVQLDLKTLSISPADNKGDQCA
ncbi:hypothetical protein K443DRAFT_14141 [Laccaria amethystina LaAM-08-1]|uniref:CCL2-like lectin domain-containing protein n=1 Tax=Laccaria amethystina LaAM-08-1 TaxID=1095629 RepID=A0A0C9X274_9AGAR|nr:hypothetical protein K443DRAFT_14141 [Laccaria amethystina LaAM-08-1]